MRQSPDIDGVQKEGSDVLEFVVQGSGEFGDDR
jgi:hypothetical protein